MYKDFFFSIYAELACSQLVSILLKNGGQWNFKYITRFRERIKLLPLCRVW